MLIIPSIDGDNLQKCNNIIRILRGFVSIIALNITDKTNIDGVIKLFDKHPAEIEIFLKVQDKNTMLQKIINVHSDVNIGKVFFYANNPETVEQEITDIRIFGIQPGIFINKDNYKIPSVVNKFEYGVIDVNETPNYIEVYKYLKENDFKGNLMVDFGYNAATQETLKNIEIDGLYTNVTSNPMIKDTISSYRRLANSMY